MRDRIPAELGALTNLYFLNFASNRLDGPIPSELGNLTNLWELNLSRNLLFGPLPPELGNLTELLSLDLRINRLQGCVPTELREADVSIEKDADVPYCDWRQRGATPAPPRLPRAARLR